jgi:cbb3-type cytochrome oxidase subunit 3
VGGEWTVTYETFRDMGIAFGVALILIYMLVVWEFGNFRRPRRDHGADPADPARHHARPLAVTLLPGAPTSPRPR